METDITLDLVAIVSTGSVVLGFIVFGLWVFARLDRDRDDGDK